MQTEIVTYIVIRNAYGVKKVILQDAAAQSTIDGVEKYIQQGWDVQFIERSIDRDWDGTWLSDREIAKRMRKIRG